MTTQFSRRTLLAAFSAMSAAALLAGCSDGGDQPKTQPSAAAGTVPSAMTKNELVVGMELAYPPFEGKDQAGKPAGVSPDFMADFAKKIGRPVRIENIAFDGLIPALQTGKVDMVMSSVTITDARRQTVDFSDPYAKAMLAILTNNASDVKRAEDLNAPGRTIAAKIGSTGYLYAKNHLTKAKVTALPDESACVMEVATGRADGFLYDQLTIYRNQQKNPDKTRAVFIPFQDAEYWGVAVRKGDEALRTALNDFIAQYRQSGGFERLTEKHLAEEKKAFDALGFAWFFDFAPAPSK